MIGKRSDAVLGLSRPEILVVNKAGRETRDRVDASQLGLEVHSTNQIKCRLYASPFHTEGLPSRCITAKGGRSEETMSRSYALRQAASWPNIHKWRTRRDCLHPNISLPVAFTAQGTHVLAGKAMTREVTKSEGAEKLPG